MVGKDVGKFCRRDVVGAWVREWAERVLRDRRIIENRFVKFSKLLDCHVNILCRFGS